VTVPGKTLRWAMARFLLLWGFYLSTPASVGTPRRPWAAHRCQRPTIPVSALPVNRNSTHANSSHGSTTTPARRGVQHTPPKAHERKTVAQRLSPTCILLISCARKPSRAPSKTLTIVPVRGFFSRMALLSRKSAWRLITSLSVWQGIL
jgi:hypothetical protein